MVFVFQSRVVSEPGRPRYSVFREQGRPRPRYSVFGLGIRFSALAATTCSGNRRGLNYCRFSLRREFRQGRKFVVFPRFSPHGEFLFPA